MSATYDKHKGLVKFAFVLFYVNLHLSGVCYMHSIGSKHRTIGLLSSIVGS